MNYPNTEDKVRAGDPVWINDAKWLVRIVRLIETENDRYMLNVEENGFSFSYEASEKNNGGYGFMPYRCMAGDYCYRATPEEIFGIRLLLHRLFKKYDIDKDYIMYSLSIRLSMLYEEDETVWKISIATVNGKMRRFTYNDRTDEWQEKPAGDGSSVEAFRWALT